MNDKYVSTVVNGMLIITGITVFIIAYAFGLLDPLFK
jgi:hypothetical protein